MDEALYAAIAATQSSEKISWSGTTASLSANGIDVHLYFEQVTDGEWRVDSCIHFHATTRPAPDDPSTEFRLLAGQLAGVREFRDRHPEARLQIMAADLCALLAIVDRQVHI
jgi:hypothetical protein